MPADPQLVAALAEQGQYFFLPYYRDVVAHYPNGILAAEVKHIVLDRLLQDAGIDVTDPNLVGTNLSNGKPRGDQWVNNLVSNHVLDPYMLVIRQGRGGRATLYPAVTDNSRPLPPVAAGLSDADANLMNTRPPLPIESGTSRTYARSLPLAEYVREKYGRVCVVASADCVAFDTPDGRPYVEVHHIVPMAAQGHTESNLDRTNNMVPLCPGCHSCLHHGHADRALPIVEAVLRWFEGVHGASFHEVNADLGLDTSAASLLRMYA